MAGNPCQYYPYYPTIEVTETKQTTEETMSRDNTTTITSVAQQVIAYLSAKVVDAALTLLRWLCTPEDLPGQP